MNRWSFDIYDETEKANDAAILKASRSSFFNENSWTPTITDKFASVVAKQIKSQYPSAVITNKVFQKEEIGMEYMLNINVCIDTIGFNKNVDLQVEMIRSPKCPTNLPVELANQFIEIIKLKIAKNKKKA